MSLGDLTSMFGGGSSSSSTTSGPAWLREGYQNLAKSATNLAEQPYQSWGGPYVAAPSADTQAAWKRTENTLGTYQPYLDQASSIMNLASAPVTQGDVSTLLNPNQKYVTQGLTQNFLKNVLPSIQDKFVGAGQSRSPQEAQVTNNATGDLNQAIGQSMAGAWSSALDAAQRQKSQQLQSGAQYGQLGSEAARLNQQDISNLGNVGGAQDTRAQTTLNAQRQDWQNQKMWPYQQMQFLSGIYGGINPQVAGLTTNQSTTQYPSTGSLVGNMLGNSSLLSSVGSMFGLKRGGSVRDAAYRSMLAVVRGGNNG